MSARSIASMIEAERIVCWPRHRTLRLSVMGGDIQTGGTYTFGNGYRQRNVSVRRETFREPIRGGRSES